MLPNSLIHFKKLLKEYHQSYIMHDNHWDLVNKAVIFGLSSIWLVTLTTSHQVPFFQLIKSQSINCTAIFLMTTQAIEEPRHGSYMFLKIKAYKLDNYIHVRHDGTIEWLVVRYTNHALWYQSSYLFVFPLKTLKVVPRNLYKIINICPSWLNTWSVIFLNNHLSCISPINYS